VAVEAGEDAEKECATAIAIIGIDLAEPGFG
jgi:hypothetical protein